MESEIYDAVCDEEGIFSSKFKKYVSDENLLCHKHKKEKYLDVWLFKKEHQSNGAGSAADDVEDVTNNLITMLETFSSVPHQSLFQFWKAEEEIEKNCCILTTRNQPFLISGSYEGDKQISEDICSYRMKMVHIIVDNGEGGGVIARVFRNKMIEATPDLRYYSCQEDKKLDLNGRIASLVIPLSDSSGQLVGVLEIVSEYELYFKQKFLIELQSGSSLRYLRPCKNLCGQCDLGNKSLHKAVSKIRKVIILICDAYDLLSAQTWMLCNSCGSLSTSESIDPKLGAYYSDRSVCESGWSLYSVAEYLCTLKKGQGIVGKATTSPQCLVYSEDFSKFTITENPLVHFNGHEKLSPSFAICLKSKLTGSQIYVIEFVIGYYDSTEELIAVLDFILERLRRNLQTLFKLASGEEIRDNLSVQVIYAQSPDEITTLRNRKREREESSETNDDSTIREYFSASTCQSESIVRVTIMAKYENDSFEFELSSDMGIHEFNQRVCQRLNLEVETYVVKYLDDDNDSILIACDDDLHHFIFSSVSKGKSVLKMMIEPI